MADGPHGLGFRTFLASSIGSTLVEVEDGVTVLETPTQPGFHDGNTLLLHAVPDPGDLAGWVERFEARFPASEHLSIWWEDESVTPDDETGDRERAWESAVDGTALERLRVMELTGDLPAAPATDLDVVVATEPEHFAAVKALSLHLAASEGHHDRADFYEWAARVRRTEVEAGRSRTWVAYRRGIPVGVLQATWGDADGDVAAVDDVMTHTEHRRTGVASLLVATAVDHARTELAGRRIALLADDESAAQRMYRRLGFVDRGVIWVLARARG